MRAAVARRAWHVKGCMPHGQYQKEMWISRCAHTKGQAQIDVPFRRGNGLVDSNANYVQDAFAKSRFLCCAGHFSSSKTWSVRRRCATRRSKPLRKKGPFTSTERRIQRLSPGIRTSTKQSRTGLENYHCDVANQLGANWKYEHPSQVMDENRRPYSAVCWR